MRQFVRLVGTGAFGYSTGMKPAFCLIPILATFFLCGCDVSVEHFPPNELHALVISTSRSVPTELVVQDTNVVVESWFGTPAEPRWPVGHLGSDAARTLVDPEDLTRSAGPVHSDRQGRHFGLFNEHCVTCHGVSGGGNGPASMLQNPYPRDFRAGVFKWKSTIRPAKPTRKDLMAILLHGAPGTGMPSFARIDTQDREALVDYVIFLSVRGEFERRLLAAAVDELGYESTRPEHDASLLSLVDSDELTDALDLATETLDRVVESWIDADQKSIEVPDETPTDAESIERGRELFHGKIANCVACHGNDGNADVVTLDFDDWTKEFTTRLSITPSDRDAVKPFRKAGALRPRQIHPRKLSDGVFRGGGNPQTLYRRLVAGIAGTPMPGVMLTDQLSATAVTSDQVWDIIHYVRSLGRNGK